MGKFRKLGRDYSHRLSLLRTMVSQLVKHERIETTLAKAKEVRRKADQMVQLGKEAVAVNNPAIIFAKYAHRLEVFVRKKSVFLYLAAAASQQPFTVLSHGISRWQEKGGGGVEVDCPAGWVLILKREDKLTAFLLHLCEGWQQIELIHWLYGRPQWAPGFLIVKGEHGVEGNSVQRASLPCMGAQHGGQARRGRDQCGGKACCERELSMEGKLAIKEELGTEERWDRDLSMKGELDPDRELTSEDELPTNGELSAKESQP
ncbi:unnamed protein product [Miscanthus lutarioriparius]|uniref:Ribosomal protein L17 n=1 Tax=Miscanthus lutarioriparius TaxID=422564 RepID=A0A811NXT4_9POAL|nr:unnamed protein product [Miscanthus lutarioriparius]